MAKIKKRITLEPHDYMRDQNGEPLYDPQTDQPLGWATYRVVEALNVVTPYVGELLTSDHVLDLINDGLDCVVRRRSEK